MGTYALKRILQLIPILLAITFLSFAMIYKLLFRPFR